MDLAALFRPLILAASLFAGSTTRSPALAEALAAPAPCGFASGFAALRGAIGGATVGECAENEHAAADGGGTDQRTTRGLMVWRQLDNLATFTDGSSTWIGRGDGIFRRANGERFSWEGGALASGLPVRYPTEVAVPETAQHP